MRGSDLKVGHWYKDTIFSSMLPVKAIETTDTEVVLNETRYGANNNLPQG